MSKPHLYINVSRTMAVALASVTILSYLFDIKNFRRDLNRTLVLMSGRSGYDG